MDQISISMKILGHEYKICTSLHIYLLIILYHPYKKIIVTCKITNIVIIYLSFSFWKCIPYRWNSSIFIIRTFYLICLCKSSQMKSSLNFFNETTHFYPFTAPAVIPLIKYFCNKKNIRAIGIVTTVDAAISKSYLF